MVKDWECAKRILNAGSCGTAFRMCQRLCNVGRQLGKGQGAP